MEASMALQLLFSAYVQNRQYIDNASFSYWYKQ